MSRLIAMTSIIDTNFPDVSTQECLPIGERVLDRLPGMLWVADEVLALLQRDESCAMQWVEPTVKRIYEDVNEMMKILAD
jgi:hypothetical protein